MTYSINAVRWPEKITQDLFQDKREDRLETVSKIVFITGQCPLDSPRDKLLFQLFSSKRTDPSGKCDTTCEWPQPLPFGKEEHQLIKNLLKDERQIQETNENGVSHAGSFILTYLFTHAANFFSEKPNEFPTIALVGSYVQEIEQKFGWAIKNLELLTGICIPSELKNSASKMAAADVDCRFYPRRPITEEVVQRATAEVINFLSSRIYWNPYNFFSRAIQDQGAQPYDSRTAEWLKMRTSLESKSLKNLNFIAALRPDQPCYSIVSFFPDNKHKAIDLSFIKNLTRKHLFTLDDSGLSLNNLIFRTYYELDSKYEIDVTKDCPLVPESESLQPIDFWQHLIDQCCYLVRGHDYATYDVDASIRYFSHLAKGGRAAEKDLEEEIVSRVTPQALADYHKRHATQPELQQAIAIVILFSLKKHHKPANAIETFWKEISQTFSKKESSSLIDGVIQALNQPGISIHVIYPLLHLLAILNLAAPNLEKHKVYLSFQDENPVYELVENFPLTLSSDIATSLNSLETQLKKITHPDALASLQSLVDYLKPAAPFDPSQQTVLQFYKEHLAFNYSQIHQFSENWISDQNPILQNLGVSFAFICYRESPNLFVFKNWIAHMQKHPHSKSILCPVIPHLLKNTPFEPLSEAIPSFEKSEPQWMEHLIQLADSDTIQAVMPLVKHSNNVRVQQELLKKYSSYNLIESLSYFFELESRLQEPESTEHACKLGQLFAKTSYSEEIRSLITFILGKPSLPQTQPFAEVFLDLILAYAALEGAEKAAPLFFEGLTKNMTSNPSQKLVRICINLGEQFLKKSEGAITFAFWERAEKFHLWKHLSQNDRNKLSFAIALQSRQLPPLSQLNPASLNTRQIKDLGELIVSAVQRQDTSVEKIIKTLKDFAKYMPAEDIDTCNLVKAEKQLQSNQWEACAKSVKAMATSSQKAKLSPLLPPLLKGLFGSKQHILAYTILTDPPTRSLIDSASWLVYCLEYLNSASHPKGELFSLLVIALKNLNGEALPENQSEQLMDYVSQLLEQLTSTLPQEFLKLVSEKKELLFTSSRKPQMTVRFLSSLMYRKIPLFLEKRAWESFLNHCTQIEDPERVHQLLLYMSDQLSTPSLKKVEVKLADSFVQRKDYRKAEIWLLSIEDAAILARLLKEIIKDEQISLALKILEKLKSRNHIHTDFHPLIALLVDHPKVAPALFLGLLIDYTYPVSDLWVRALERLKVVKNQEPRFLKTLQNDASFFRTFKKEPGILSACVFAASHSLSSSHNSYVIEFCKAEVFWKPLIQNTPAKNRLAFFENCLEGLFLHLKDQSRLQEVEELIWSFEEKIDILLDCTSEKDLPVRPTGLGWKVKITEAFASNNHVKYLNKCSIKLTEAFVAQLENSLEIEESFVDFEKMLYLLAKKCSAHILILLCAEKSSRLFHQIKFDKLFKILSDPSIYSSKNNGNNILVYRVTYTLIKSLFKSGKTLDLDLQLAILKFIQKSSQENFCSEELKNILTLPFFNTFTEIKAEMFGLLTRLRFIQLVASISGNDPEDLYSPILKELDSLVEPLERLTAFPSAEASFMNNAFFLLLHFFGFSGNLLFFRKLYIKLLRKTCIMPIDNFTCVTEGVPNPFECSLKVDQPLTMQLKDSQQPEKLFSYMTLMLQQMLGTVYKNPDFNTTLLDFIWKQILFLIESFPAKSEEIYRLMCNGISTSLVANDDYALYIYLAGESLSTLSKKGFFVNRQADKFRIDFYLNMYINSEYEMKILHQDIISQISVDLIERLIATNNPYQVNKAIVLLKNLQHVGMIFLTGKPGKEMKITTEPLKYLTNSPHKMIQIYENLIDQVKEWPLVQVAYPFTTQSFLQPLTRNSAYYNLTIMLAENKYFSEPKWASFSNPLITKWLTVLCELHEKNPDDFDLFCVQHTFLKTVESKGLFKGRFLEYNRLLQKIFESYLRFLAAIPKTYDLIETIEISSPLNLFPSKMSKKDEALLQKTFNKLMQDLNQIKHWQIEDFIKILQANFLKRNH